MAVYSEKGMLKKKKDVGQNTEHPTSATTSQDKSFVQTDKDNGSQSADTHSDKQHPSADKGSKKAEKKQKKQSVFDKAKGLPTRRRRNARLRLTSQSKNR